MTQVYVPWSQRRRRFSAAEQRVVDLAVLVYRAASPVVRRFPGPIFLIALVVTSIAVWLVGSTFTAVDDVYAFLIASGRTDANSWLALDVVRGVDPQVRGGIPAPLIWLCQSTLLRDAVVLGGILGFISLVAMVAIWGERKVAGHMQSRLGPMRVGGWHGWAQSLADGIKLVAKEDLIPAEADRALFRLAPYLALVPAVAAFLALPFSARWVFRDMDVALLILFALLGVEVMGVLIAGWASNNKWSVYGAMREACQMVSYEIALGLSLLIPILIVGSLQLTTIAGAQSGGWFNWLAWHSPFAFVALFLFFTASLAACKRAPFDLPEAESELVAGFHTEYSGIRWALFFFAEYTVMFVVGGIVAILFLGAWDAPWVGLAPSGLAESRTLGGQFVYGLVFSGPIWFILKCSFMIYVQMWLRWTLPRLRIDQVLYTGVQVLVPLALVTLLAATAWELLLDASPAFRAVADVLSIVLGLIGAAGVLLICAVAAAGIRRGHALVGAQAITRPLRGG